MQRNLIALAIVLGVTAGLLWALSLLPGNYQLQLSARPLIVPKGARARIGGSHGPVVTGAWQLSSPDPDFGSYSALIMPQPGTLVAISDRGRYLRMKVPPARRSNAAIAEVVPGQASVKRMQDIESATLDPKTGRIWLAYEGRNLIMRTGREFRDPVTVRPKAMRHWPGNLGAESMARLPDGRFLVLSESARKGPGDRQALLFPGDPVGGAEPLKFLLVPPRGYRPSDMALLPDGRVLILVRAVERLPYPHFAAQLLLADPATISEGRPWRWQSVAELAGAVPRENYEGMTVTGRPGGMVTIWIVSDDNEARITQRTLLLRLEWKVPGRSAQKKRRADLPRAVSAS